MRCCCCCRTTQAKSCVLLCTDVAARGLDFPAVSTIIQYDPAGDPAEYVHRVGRTARMGQHGEALLFLLPSEVVYVELLQQRGMQLQQEKASDLLRTLPLLLSSGGGGGANAHSRSSSGVLKLARKLQQESAQQGGGGGRGGGSSKRSSSEQAVGGSLSAARAEQMAAALLLQRQLLLAISGDQELRQMALNAFR
jgi:ATP-dependent RNA helicase DDX31/DBP7